MTHTRRQLLAGALLSSLSLLLPRRAQADITSNLVLHWNFDTYTGTTVTDNSGGGNTGTSVGTPAAIAGKVGTGAIDFNDAADGLTFTGFDPGANYTIACWIFPVASSDDPDGSLLVSTSGGQGWFFYENNLTHFYSGGDNYSTISMSQNAWHHVAVVVSGTSVTQYADGVAAGTTATGGTITFARAGWSTAQSYRGRMDDMRVYARALTVGDIGELVALGTASVSAKRRLLIY
jgi:hypothetical protein